MFDVSAKFDRLADRVNASLMRHVSRDRMTIQAKSPLVSFTFDDVPDTALTNGAAILERYGVRGTFYIACGLLGRQEPDRTLITDEGCQTLEARGHEIGCHTFTHRKMRLLTQTEIADDLSQNSAVLDAIDGGSLKRNFAYPYNAASFRARRLFQQRFVTCRGGGDRINRGAVNRAFLYGMEIRQPETAAHALTAHIDDLVDHPGWLIFFTHDIAEKPTDYGCTPETFERLVAYAVERGCTILPVREALEQLSGADQS